MSAFTEPLSITQVSCKPRRWRLDKSFRFYSGKEGSDTWYEVLVNFECDGGSLPRLVWSLESPIGQGAKAFFGHDALYRARAAERLKCDQLMREGLQVLQFGPVRMNLIYSQVRWWGGLAWTDHTPASVAEARRYIRTSWQMPDLRDMQFPLEVMHAG